MEAAIQQEIVRVSQILNDGGVILYPTDTIWGLGCDATNKEAIDKIYFFKHRSPFKSMIILVENPDMIHKYVNEPSPILIAAMTQSSTPTTGIFPNAKILPSNLINKDGSIGIRIASDEFCKELILRFGKPIVSTSANISDRPSPQNFSEIELSLVSQVDYTVYYRRDDVSKRVASAIIRLDENNQIERIR